MLAIHDLAVRYDKIEAIRGVHLECAEGEMISVIGRNGSGKSTLLKAISGLVPIVNGEIEFFDQRIDKIKTHRIVALGIALVPEGRRVFGRMSVLENLQLGTTVLKDRDQRQEILGFLFQVFPVLKERLKQQAGTLSGGEQQMLAIGRALMSKPKLLMADEVTMGLAPLVAANICKNLKEITERQTVSIILVEQNAKIALEVAERSYLLEGGEIVLSGKARDMAGNTEVRKVYLGID